LYNRSSTLYKAPPTLYNRPSTLYNRPPTYNNCCHNSPILCWFLGVIGFPDLAEACRGESLTLFKVNGNRQEELPLRKQAHEKPALLIYGENALTEGNNQVSIPLILELCYRPTLALSKAYAVHNSNQLHRKT
jgi:hypothetical protein